MLESDVMLKQQVRRVVRTTMRRAGEALSGTQLVSDEILGNPIVVYKNTVRKSPDYDDAWLLACALRSRQMLDVGSSVGQTAILVLSLSGLETIGLVDANATALGRAATSLAHSRQIHRARFFYGFAAAKDGDAVLLHSDGYGAAGSRFAGHSQSSLETARVPTATVDTICREVGLQPDFIKIDVEGAESEVLAGIDVVAARKPRILVEMHRNPELSMERNVALVLEECSRLGYWAWYLAKEHRLHSADPVKHRGRFHVLLQPAGDPYPDWLKGIPQKGDIEQVLAAFRGKFA